VILWANRNGILYLLDRRDGQFLMGKPFVNVNWLDGFDAKGRPQFDPAKLVQPGSSRPGTNWQSPSFSPRTGWLYVSAQERQQPGPGNGVGAIRAFDPQTGERRWEFAKRDAWFFSVLTTGSDLLFSGARGDPASGPAGRREDGFFYALDARTGEMLWRTSLGGSVFGGGPVTYSAGGRQYIAVTGGDTLFAFALRP
jgi:outer membrane protein assembly factor BamB